ncbi:hypothetical protein B0H17DRAFT_1211151 [Mycena rosella]|uniref:Uncharacterized protein n=1 Tax=Mycena rosella TaxID=1033263 RepID=A0AAD7CUN7_MYCRO|nr:hypothetical protein B0H17DRAFT_1211151 [Mycena rosella]
MAAPTSRPASTRAAATKIDKNISAIAANDLLDSDDEFPVHSSVADADMTLVNSDGSDDKEGEIIDVEVDEEQELSEEEEEDDEDKGDEDKDEDAGSEEEEEEEEEEVTAGKRKRGAATKAAKEQPAAKKTRGPAKKSVKKPADTRKITYTISTFSLSDMKKSKSARKPTKTAILTLPNSEPFDTLKAQIFIRIAAALHPAQENYDDYNITFTVPW